MDIAAPAANKIPKELTIHDHTRIDNYYWLNDRENQEGVINYLNAENAYTDEMMSHTKALQESLFQRNEGTHQEDDQSVPYKDNGYYYITRYEQGQECPIHSRKKGSLDAAEKITAQRE
ncbi:MAG: hypothetical protein R2795_07360 [Saprospiraceae bacterium]